MRHSLVPILLLATVAISSSNVLPMLSLEHLNSEQLPLDSQHNDNTFSNRFETKNLLNEIFKSTFNNKQTTLRKAAELNDDDTDNNNIDDNSNQFNKMDQYNGEGFRQEQWHNYPRQLDRLHGYRNVDRRYIDSNDPGNEHTYNTADTQNSNNKYLSNEFSKDMATQYEYDSTGMNTSPLLILKIRLACIGDGVENLDQNNILITPELDFANLEQNTDDDQSMANDINPDGSMTKIKREDETNLEEKTNDKNSFEGKTVRKRIFSLWSRLKSLNHKGHELHHRRHLHAFYGMPDGDGGGVLTAETRAILMRPPGSPLRWG